MGVKWELDGRQMGGKNFIFLITGMLTTTFVFGVGVFYLIGWVLMCFRYGCLVEYVCVDSRKECVGCEVLIDPCDI